MRPPILFPAAYQRGQVFADRFRGARPSFLCVLGHTDTCLIPGVSSAGVSPELRPLTPAADAEVVHLGRPVCLPELPSNPLGAPGPAGITRAALQCADLRASFVGAGLHVWPATACVQVSTVPGADIRLGRSVPNAADLFETGLGLGRRLASEHTHLVIGESVPAGTTTALAVLLALGYAAYGRVSGSMPGNAHALKREIVSAAMRAAGLEPGDGRPAPLAAVAAIGDPMQPLVAGLALGAASLGCDVLLAGGSQMLAVAALVQALHGPAALERMAVGTTRWIVEDPAADIPGLAADISADLPVLAANLDFSGSRHAGLRSYEQFLVKEGVGAGGACIAALLATGLPIERLEDAIDATYDGLLDKLEVITRAADRL
jgi:uncharacterized protein (TIGR00303 family)